MSGHRTDKPVVSSTEFIEIHEQALESRRFRGALLFPDESSHPGELLSRGDAVAAVDERAGLGVGEMDAEARGLSDQAGPIGSRVRPRPAALENLV